MKYSKPTFLGAILILTSRSDYYAADSIVHFYDKA